MKNANNRFARATTGSARETTQGACRKVPGLDLRFDFMIFT
jgi:hypothetical protein